VSLRTVPDLILLPMTARLPVTVVVPVRAEAALMAGCLGRLNRFERVVVVDSGSTDGTVEIAKDHGAEVVDFRWDGRFPKKRNWFLRNIAVSTPWVFFLDADELVDDRFCNELERVLPSTAHVGFWLNYDRWFLGRRLRFGEPNRKLALFRIGTGEYERVEEKEWTPLDMEVHEHPILRGTTGEISARIDHRDFRSLDHWLEKHRQYAKWEANRLLAFRERGSPSWSSLSPRQRWKYSALGRWWLPPAYFAYAYILRLGLLDGWSGLAYAWFKARYFSQIRERFRERLVSTDPGQRG
jgi:glycosyltransferase involved in cell wall biosynthesis